MPRLEIRLLGPPLITWTGRPLAVPRRQARALLYRLAVRQQLVSRHHLCTLFWPATPESRARRNLSHLLTHLRRALPEPDVLLTIDDHVSLASAAIWSDTTAFQHHYAGWQTDRCATALESAADFYRGTFLEGFDLSANPEFDAWLTQERQHWERRYLNVLAALIEERSARGAYQEAITYGHHYLAVDELAEDVHRRLIELYAATGDQSAASRQFERCLMVLERELGVRPLPETRVAYENALAGQMSPIRLPAAPTWTTLPSLDSPFVGRDQALEWLEQIADQVRSGHGRMVLISGESGIGKSRLMQTFTSGWQRQALILVGAGHLQQRTLPYRPLVQALRSVLHDSCLLSGVSHLWLTEVSRLLPELQVLFPALPPPLAVEPHEAQGRLFEALRQVVLHLASGPRPVVLCLDDLHWADNTTLEWLTYLAQTLPHSRLFVLGSCRSEEADTLAEMCHGLTRLKLLTEIKLGGLDETAVLQLLRHLAGPVDGDRDLAQRLQAGTGGNPFFLLEIIRTVMESGRSLKELVGVKELPLPDSIQEATVARLQQLSPVTRQVLETASILNSPFSLDWVYRTAGRRPIEVMDSLDELVARQLLLEQDTGYQFHHGLTRRAVEATLSPVRRQLLHRRAGRALEQLEPQAVTELAHYFEMGNEVEKALRYHDLAAQQAESLFAWQEAETHQSCMLALLARLDPECSQSGSRRQRGHILADRAHLHFLQGRQAERDADLRELVALARTSGDEKLRLTAFVHQVRYFNLDSRYETAIRVAREGLTLAQRLNDVSARCRLLAQVGFAHYFLGQPHQALAALESALVIAGKRIDLEMRGRIVHILGYVYFHLGNYARALACQQEAYLCHQTLEDYNRLAWDGLDIGILYLEMGHPAESRQYLTESLTLARRIGARPAEAYGLTQFGVWELYQGNYATATTCFQESLAIQQEVRSEHGRVAAEIGIGLTFYHLGDLAQAHSWLEQAARRARSVNHRRRLAEALIGLGLVEIAAGRFSRARVVLDEAVTIAGDSQCRENRAAGLAALAWAERRLDHLDSAMAHAGEAVSLAKEGMLPLYEMWGKMEMSLILLAQGESVSALEHSRQAVALIPRANESWIGTERVHRAHALVLQDLDETESAARHISVAEALVAAKASRIPDAQQCQRYLATPPQSL